MLCTWSTKLKLSSFQLYMPDRANASLKPFDVAMCNYSFSSAVVCRQQYVSLVKFPRLLLVNAEWFQMEEDTACFPRVLIWSGIFGRNCLPTRFWYSSHWERLFDQKCNFQSSRGMLFASYIPALASVSVCPGKRQLSLCGSHWTVISALWRPSTPCVPARKKSKNQGAIIQKCLIKNRVGKG